MFEDYLNDTCDIYHLTDEPVDAGYGIAVTTEQQWPEEPDEEDVTCHFHVTNNGLQIVQQEPHAELTGSIKLSLPYGTDIRKNDLVISKASQSIESGLRFRADTPRTIHANHHIIVTLQREDGVKGAI